MRYTLFYPYLWYKSLAIVVRLLWCAMAGSTQEEIDRLVINSKFDVIRHGVNCRIAGVVYEDDACMVVWKEDVQYLNMFSKKDLISDMPVYYYNEREGKHYYADILPENIFDSIKDFVQDNTTYDEENAVATFKIVGEKAL